MPLTLMAAEAVGWFDAARSRLGRPHTPSCQSTRIIDLIHTMSIHLIKTLRQGFMKASPRGRAKVSQAMVLVLSGLMFGCATTPTPLSLTPDSNLKALPDAWMAPVPHQGSVTRLSEWWQRFEDPFLLDLIKQAQEANPTLEMAAARLDQARAEAQQARAAGSPQGGLGAQWMRSRQMPELITASQHAAQLSVSWEWDLFGRLRAQHDAASAQVNMTQTEWHEARVSLAADVASAYLALRHAQAQEEIAEWDTRAAQSMAEWAEMRRQRGLDSVSDVALLNAHWAFAVATRATRRAEAANALQVLSVLTAQAPTSLAQRLMPLETGTGSLQRRVPQAPPFAWAALPLNTLAQRPDLLAAHHQWLAAAYSEQGVQADAWPRLSLTALIGYSQWGSLSGAVGSLGPSLSLPLFDGGLRQGQRDAAAARTRQAAAAFEARWRQAFAEVEEALQSVASAGERQREADRSRHEWERVVSDANLLAAAGIQSGPQRVGSQRNALAAYSAVLAIHHEHAQAWVRLYRALGGGFEPQNDRG